LERGGYSLSTVHYSMFYVFLRYISRTFISMHAPFNKLEQNMATRTKNENIDELILDFSRFYILTILFESPAHGYHIISRFKKRVKKEVSPSLVYPFLKQLEKKGLVKHKVRSVGEKKRKVFELTQEGRELCISLFKRFADLVSIAIESSLYVCAHCGCKIYEGGYREAIEGKETTFCCMHCSHSYRETRKLANKVTQ